jgi:hypothetical protein
LSILKINIKELGDFLMDIRDKIQNNSLNYLPKQWAKLNIPEKIKIIANTIELLRECTIEHGTDIFFCGKHAHFEGFTIANLEFDVKIDGLYDGVGYFDPSENLITLDESCLYNGLRLYEILIHEFIHKLQCEIVKRFESEVPTIKQAPYAMALTAAYQKNDVEFSLFGISCGSCVYVDGLSVYNDQTMDSLSSMLYVLSSTERHAFTTAERYARSAICCQMSECVSNYETSARIQLDGAIGDFKNLYGADKLKTAEIYNVIDRAQFSIVRGTLPETNLVASVAYDWTVLLALQNEVISLDQYVQLMHFDVKQKTLKNLGYDTIIGAAHRNVLPPKAFLPEDAHIVANYLAIE